MSKKSINFAAQIKIDAMMRKFFSFFAMAAVVLGMASCGDGNTPSDPKPVYTVYDKTTHVMTYYCDDRMESHKGDNFIVEEYNPNLNPSNTRLEAHTYYPNVLKVVIDPSMKNYPYTSMQNIFGSYYIPGSNDEWVGLKSMTMIEGLENLPTAKVTDMSYMFDGCNMLKSLDLSSFNTAKVTDMRVMFRRCGKLESLDLSSFNTAKVTDMHSMFAECSSLTSLDLRSFNTANVEDMRFMFEECSNLTTIYCNDDWSASTSLDSHLMMFQDCPSLKGGNGTEYDESHVNVRYAHPDGGKNNPGYFTRKADYNGVNGWRYYDNNKPLSPFGPNNNTLFYWAVMYPANTLSAQVLDKIGIFVSHYNTTAMKIAVVQGGETPSVGGEVLENRLQVKPTATSGYELREIDCNIPFDNTQNLWIVAAANAGYPAVVCVNTGDPNSRWFSTDNKVWGDVAETFAGSVRNDYSFMIRGHFK